ncbi:SusD/RagB family nutrient-binding outer membrane lipoprotein [archaeon]|nr:MAG: SusD/RagB family nutrient-binding outer membrane lipoprotein [archaeon]
MYNNMKKYISVIAGAVLMFAACKPSDFGDVNESPYALQGTSSRSLLTNALKNLAGTVSGYNSSVFYVQYLSEGPYPGASRYSTRNFSFDGNYTGPLYDLQAIINANTGKPNVVPVSSEPGLDGSVENQIAVARIMKAYFYWWMTDRWGDIPYSQALQGAANVLPKYDTQESIYTDLFKELREAVAQINTATTGVGGDILLGGDMTAWKRFANTMRMQMALRYKDRKNAVGKTEFNDAITAGVITSVSQDVYYRFIANDPNNWNPYYANYSIANRNDYAISITMTNYMNPKNDPRLRIYAETLPSGNVVGLIYGSSTARNIPNVYSRIGTSLRAAGAPALVFSRAQVLFAMAEMTLPDQAWLPGGHAQAAIYYNQAIEASFVTWGVASPTAAAATYAAQANVVYNPANALQQIMTEKWVHLYLNGYESWADWRRTGFPVLTPSATPSRSTTIPVRQAYGTTEVTVNGVAYREAVARQGADNLNTRVWWDVN